MPTKSGRTSYLCSDRDSGGWTCWWYPPYTEPTHAYNVVTTAASVNDASTPDQLLGITRRAEDGLLSPIALERWESDGGAIPHTPRSQLEMQDA